MLGLLAAVKGQSSIRNCWTGIGFLELGLHNVHESRRLHSRLSKLLRLDF